MLSLFEKIGAKTIDFLQEVGKFSKLLGGILRYTPNLFKKRKLLLYQMEHIGVDSLPLVIIIAVFTGGVAAWQAAYQLKGVAPISFLGTATSRAIITELGPVLTAIIIAGRVGASIAAEIGSMKVTEQIDAMEVMGISPIMYLAMPRFYAAVLMMPILVVIANVIAVAGAFVISNYFLDVSYAVFFDSVKRFFEISDFLFGMIKGVVFGGITSLMGCHIGFLTEGGAEGVGASTIRSFVLTSALILIFDYFLWTLVF
ncbi:MAG: ABC transporter permease [Ignavibacteriae bacterium HGW-Ignavibacteriae-2]|jgi:phospholipid/cholesterol/gamma-HCH transport system permease protein|nr:ABC transporter permease [Bacteroidota bacterium]PKL89152.1 MAG: ABC transporter permease [Ignavibacteriae bacterium HGW-Ignavibacteriae-2]